MSANLEPLLLQAEPGLMSSSASSALDKPAPPRHVAGVRLSALLEIVAFVAIALAIDALWGAHNRYADLSPHPFWIDGFGAFNVENACDAAHVAGP